MIIALLGPPEEHLNHLVATLEQSGFTHVPLDEACPGPESLLVQAHQLWGRDFRVRLTRHAFDILRNEVVTGIAHREELLLLSRLAPTAVLDAAGRLSPGDIAMLAAAGIPVHQEADRQPPSPEQVRSRVLELATQLPRISWDEYFMRIARVVAGRGDCLKRRVAAIIVKERRIIATGYNGAPRGARNCSQGGCPRCASFGPSGTDLGECLCSHGEENAITQAAYHGISVKGATLYSTCSPCLLCTKMVINSGIGEVVYNAEYPLARRALELLRESAVRIRQFG